MYRDPVTGEVRPLKRLDYSHEAMADYIIANPAVSKTELAQVFGMSLQWVSTVTASDAFRAFVRERKKEIVDPILLASMDEKLRGLAATSLEKLQERLDNPAKPVDDEFLLKTAKLALDASGYGARAGGGGTQVQVGVVVQVPPRAASAKEWAEQYGARGPEGVIDAAQ